jgi:hypothetical protein
MRVTGIGNVFLKENDPKAMAALDIVWIRREIR